MGDGIGISKATILMSSHLGMYIVYYKCASFRLRAQCAFIKNVVPVFFIIEHGVLDCKFVLSPLDSCFNLPKATDLSQITKPFTHLVCALFWIARLSHLVIMWSAAYLARFRTCYTCDDFLAALGTLQYLSTIKERKLKFEGGLLPSR